MYCSGCGQPLAPGQTFCPNCGRAAAPMPPVAAQPFPGFQFELDSYAGKIKALGILWFVYAGLSLLAGIAGLAFMKAIFFGGFGPWMHPWAHPWMQSGMHGPMPPVWFFPAILPFIWVFILIRVALAVAAGWGLLLHAHWGRIVGIIAAILSLIKFPFGTALGIFTLVVLLGFRNTRLYEQL